MASPISVQLEGEPVILFDTKTMSFYLVLATTCGARGRRSVYADDATHSLPDPWD